MKDWENTLESLRRRGWDYGYVKCLDETGGDIYSVHLRRGMKNLEYGQKHHRRGGGRHQPTGRRSGWRGLSRSEPAS